MKTFPAGLFALAVLAVGTAAHLVILAWARRAWPRMDAHRRAYLLGAVALSALPSASRQVVLLTRSPVADVVNAASMIELSFAAFLAVPLAVLVLRARMRDRAAMSAPPPHAEAPAGSVDVARRDALHTLGGAAMAGATGLVVGWGFTRGRHDFTVREVPVRIPGLPKALDGYVITQVSDLHAGLFTQEEELRQGFDLIRAIKPDLVVATGDLVDFDARDAPLVARALGDLPSRDGVFAILGNHDYYAGAGTVTEAMRRAGVNMLVNQSHVVRPRDGGGFALLGLDDEWSPRYGGPGADLELAARGLAPEVPRILLAHQPQAFRRSAGKVALQLSGHTHGGQILPATALLELFRGWTAGRYERKGSTLYVNSGYGVAGPPARIGVPPEVTKLVLVAA